MVIQNSFSRYNCYYFCVNWKPEKQYSKILYLLRFRQFQTGKGDSVRMSGKNGLTTIIVGYESFDDKQLKEYKEAATTVCIRE